MGRVTEYTRAIGGFRVVVRMHNGLWAAFCGQCLTEGTASVAEAFEWAAEVLEELHPGRF